MKLYHDPFSPNCRKVLMTAMHLGIPLETQAIGLRTGEHRAPEYLKLNPNGLVPTLVDGDFVLWESNAIMQYLASKTPGNTLWPSDERARADIARWQYWDVAHWVPAHRTHTWENMIKPLFGLGQPDAAELKKGEEKFHRFTGVLNGHLANRDFLVGKTLTLADLSVAPYLMYAQPSRFPLEGYANVRRWFGQIEALSIWRETTPPPLA